MDITELVLMLILMLFVIVAVVLVLLFWPKPQSQQGTITIKVGSHEQIYPYTIGNGIFTGMGMCNAIVINLPIRVPHMVIDSHKNDRAHTGLPCQPQASQRLQLEGVTYKDFALYTPKGIEQQALMFLTPDVMQTLIDDGSRYDVEFFLKQITIMSSTQLDENDGSMQAILDFAQRFMEEVGHKLLTWSESDANEIATTYLAFEGGQPIKYKWHTFNSRWVGAVSMFALVALALLVPTLFKDALTAPNFLLIIFLSAVCGGLTYAKLP